MISANRLAPQDGSACLAALTITGIHSFPFSQVTTGLVSSVLLSSALACCAMEHVFRQAKAETDTGTDTEEMKKMQGAKKDVNRSEGRRRNACGVPWKE